MFQLVVVVFMIVLFLFVVDRAIYAIIRASI